MAKKKYFITGGGTGGHIYPAIAVADELRNKSGTETIYYVGNPNNLEASIVKDKNYTFLPVVSSGMPRKASLQLVKWAWGMFCAWLKCIGYIKKYKPDVIFGTGGYVSAPVLFAGVTTGVPFVMHDCDANPGLVTRKLAPFAKSISVAFESAKTKLKNNNCFVYGNPIRHDFALITRPRALEILGLEDKLTICIMGGSQGAKRINDAAVGIIKDLSQDLNLQIIFQTGKKNYEDVIARLKQIYPEFLSDKNIIVRPYFDNMPVVLKTSDIAVSRAGSLSISELCASGTAAIFIPYPYAAADHQRKNAKCMVEHNAGLYLEDDDTNPESLYKLIQSLVNNPEHLENIQKTALSFAKYDAVEKIAQLVTDSV